jgi:hypothetical protein
MTATAEPDSQAQRRVGIFAPVREGEICVVTKLGDVIPLNQQRLAADLENRIFPTSRGNNPSHEIAASSGDPKSIVDLLPSVTDTRYTFAASAELLDEFWRSNTEARAIDQQAALDRRLARSETWQTIDRQEAVTGSLQSAKQGVIHEAEAGVDMAFRAAPHILFGMLKALDYLADFLMPPPPPTKEQVRQSELAAAQQSEIDMRITRPAQDQAARFREIEDEGRDRERERQRER